MNAATYIAHRAAHLLESLNPLRLIRRVRPHTIPVDVDDRTRCWRAVKLYLDTLHAKPDGTLTTMTATNNALHADALALRLIERGDIGLELGGRGDAAVRLKFHRGTFSITPGNRGEMHRRWEDEIGAKFKAADLHFNYHFRSERN